jgi:hypothetical protein
MLTTVTLSTYGPSGLDLYVSLYILEYFILTLLHSPFNPRARKIIDVTGYVLFATFLIIVALKVLEILIGVRIL